MLRGPSGGQRISGHGLQTSAIQGHHVLIGRNPRNHDKNENGAWKFVTRQYRGRTRAGVNQAPFTGRCTS
jgi:hypothetical protein